jgi:hypothetical protein
LGLTVGALVRKKQSNTYPPVTVPSYDAPSAAIEFLVTRGFLAPSDVASGSAVLSAMLAMLNMAARNPDIRAEAEQGA